MTQLPLKPDAPGGPPKVDRDNLETREALLRRGLEVLTEQSFSATGLDYILKEIGIPKGSFYHYFTSKEAFGRAVLDEYARYFAQRLDHWLLDEALSPLERLVGFVQSAKSGMARHDYRRGCMVGNLGQKSVCCRRGFVPYWSRRCWTGSQSWPAASGPRRRMVSWLEVLIAMNWPRFSGSAGKGRCSAPDWSKATHH